MQVVLDCSVAVSWFFADESNPGADRVREALRLEPGVVPAIWPVEIANVLAMAARRGRISVADMQGFLADARDLPIRIDRGGWDTLTRSVELASQEGLSVYDAMYLELAIREQRPLATFDKQLIEAARRHSLYCALL